MSGGGGSTDTTIHPDQSVKDAYVVAVWAASDPVTGQLPKTIGLFPYSFGMSDVNNAFLDFHTNFFLFFMANVDIESAYDQTQAKMVDGPVVSDMVAAQNIYLEDEINQNTLFKLKTHLSNIGAVMTSSYMDTVGIVEMNKVKALTQYRATLNTDMLKLSHSRWEKHLEWNKNIVDEYLHEIVSYYQSADVYTKTGNDVSVNNALWGWKILDQYRAIVGCLNGAPAGGSTVTTPSAMQQAGSYVGMAAGVTDIASSLKGIFSSAPATTTT
jgi:hypothetical protein